MLAVGETLSRSAANDIQTDHRGMDDTVAPVLLPEPTVSTWQFGLELSTPVPCTDIVATFVVPRDYPEQKVRIVDRQLDRPLSVEVRNLPQDTARQIVVTANRIPGGAKLSATVTMEITKHNIGPPVSTNELRIAPKIDRDLKMFTGNSPHINASHGSIRRAGRELTDQLDSQIELNDWGRVEAIYDFVREKVRYVEGPIRNASDALRDGKGDCEDMTSLFVAMCRNASVPARMVWIPGHCYPEFYLIDDKDRGHWYPCQVAGTRAFGEMPESRPILQKGDKFKIPESTAPVRYLAEHFRCDKRGRGNPRPKFVLKQIQQS